MSRLVLLFNVFYLTVTAKSVLAEVRSCYACAGPQQDCVANNRTDFLKMDCNTFKVEGESLAKHTLEPDLIEKFDSEIGSRKEGSKIGCLTLIFKRGAERALKTCVPAQVFEQDICEYMGDLVAVIGGEKTSCYFCKEDDCNSAISNSNGKFVMFVMFIIYFCKYLL